MAGDDGGCRAVVCASKALLLQRADRARVRQRTGSLLEVPVARGGDDAH